MTIQSYRGTGPVNHESNLIVKSGTEQNNHEQLDADEIYRRRQRIVGELATSFAGSPLSQSDLDTIYANYPVQQDDSLPESPTKSQLIGLIRDKGGDAKTLATHELREMISRPTLDNASTIELANLASLLADINNQEKRYSADQAERKKVVDLAGAAMRLLSTVDTTEGLAEQGDVLHRINAHYTPASYEKWDRGPGPDLDPEQTIEPETLDDPDYIKTRLEERELAEFLERD